MMTDHDESMPEIWASALQEYVKQGGWKEVQELIDSHATLFGSERGVVQGEFGEGEYSVYKAFRELALKTLDNLLDELGCKTEDDEERLCLWIKAHAASPSSGPREEVAKGVLADLMSVDDFASFVQMMRKRNDELDAKDLELHLLAEPKEQIQPKRDDNKSENENLIEIRVTDEDTDENQQAEKEIPPPLMSCNEWELQIGIAQSILLAHNEGKLREEDLAYVGWAEALTKIAKLMHTAGWDDDPDLCIELYRELALQRFRVELSVAERAVFQERAARAQAARAIARVEDNALEARVSAALARCDELQREVAVSRGACVKDSTISDANLELGYLLIKSMLQKRQDLVDHADEIYETLHGNHNNEKPVHGIREEFKNDQQSIPHSKQQQPTGTGIIVDLVRWCAIEAELSTVRKRIATMLGDADARPEPHTPVSPNAINVEWVECLDTNTDYVYYVNPQTGESQWDKPPNTSMSTTVQEEVKMNNADHKREETPTLNIPKIKEGQQESKETSLASVSIVKNLPIKAEAKPSSNSTVELLSAKLSAFTAAKSEAKQAALAPPPLGLPVVPTWGRRLAPLGGDTANAKQENGKKPNSGLGLSTTALDFLKKRDLQLPETKPVLGSSGSLKIIPTAPPSS